MCIAGLFYSKQNRFHALNRNYVPKFLLLNTIRSFRLPSKPTHINKVRVSSVPDIGFSLMAIS
jgi:hypothetical protein